MVKYFDTETLETKQTEILLRGMYPVPMVPKWLKDILNGETN